MLQSNAAKEASGNALFNVIEFVFHRNLGMFTHSMRLLADPQFLRLCVSSLLFFSSFNMIIPELPGYLESIGGGEYKGLIIALFTATAGLARPFSGKLTDTVGRIPVMIFGVAVCIICGVLYPLTSTVFAFLSLRFLHGLSTGFKPTATAAYVADVVHAGQRGEAMGLLGFFGSLGMALGPWAGSAIAGSAGIDWTFYASACAAFLSIAILFNMRETLAEPRPFRRQLLIIKRDEIISWKVMRPAIAMMLMAYPFGVFLTYIPDLSTQLHIENKGTFFVYYTMATLGVRILAGRAADRYGRVPLLRSGSLILVLASALFMFVQNDLQLKLLALMYGIGTGMSIPTLFAWTADLSPPEERGKGMATLYIALEIGIGGGALLTGWLMNISNNAASAVFFSPVVVVSLGILYMWFSVRKTHDVYLQERLQNSPG